MQVGSFKIADNLYIGLTKSDLYTQKWVAWSDKRQVLFIFKYNKNNSINHQTRFISYKH